MNRLITTLISLTFTATLQFTARADDWPQWRGPDRTDISKETGVLKQWPAGGPKQVWLSKEVGLGYAGPSIVGGKLFTMGARGGKEFLLCLDAATGKELWATEMADFYDNAWGGGPRGTPTVDGDRVYAMSGKGTLLCAAVADGKAIWKTNMTDLGGKIPQWGYTESPLIDGPKVLCTPGESQGAIAALDKMTGKPLWQSKEFTQGAQYSSIIAADINGGRQYIQRTMKHVVGVAAADGKLLWSVDFPGGRTAVIPTPIVRDNFVYVSAGYGAGCLMVKIGASNEATKVYENKVMGNHHGGVILVGENLYGYSEGKGWVCQNFLSGEQVWADKTLGKGAVGCCTEGLLYCLDENSGAVVLIEASPKGWAEHGRFTLNPQTTQRSPKGKIWTHPVVANGKLYLRDQELQFCFDVKQ